MATDLLKQALDRRLPGFGSWCWDLGAGASAGVLLFVLLSSPPQAARAAAAIREIR